MYHAYTKSDEKKYLDIECNKRIPESLYWNSAWRWLSHPKHSNRRGHDRRHKHYLTILSQSS